MSHKNVISMDLVEANSVAVSESGCWLWLNAVTHKGYGLISIAGEGRLSAHRVSWRAKNGSIPADMHVLHACDVPCCVNPDHLWLGTNADNHADKAAKGRSCRGKTRPLSKLTDGDISEIRASSLGPRALGRMYGVAHSTISRVKSGEMWKHVS